MLILKILKSCQNVLRDYKIEHDLHVNPERDLDVNPEKSCNPVKMPYCCVRITGLLRCELSTTSGVPEGLKM